MGVSRTLLYRMRQGRHNITQNFVLGAAKAFPGCRLEDLFYLTTNRQAEGITGPLRRHQIIRARKSGLTYAEIAHRFGITKERVRQIVTPKQPKPKPEKPELQSKGLLTPGETASLLGIHTNTLRRWSDNGVIRAYRIGQRRDRRFQREDVDAFLRKGEVRN